jgi:hypothetical protein
MPFRLPLLRFVFPTKSYFLGFLVVDWSAAMLCIAAGRGSNPRFDMVFWGLGDCYEPVTVTTKGLCKAGLA